jgi:hypothetical protein
VKGDIRVTPSPGSDAAREPERATAPAPEQSRAAARAAGEPPAIDLAVIAAEVQALRRGRGMRGDVAGRIGPLLRELAAGGRPPGGGPAGPAPAPEPSSPPGAGSDAAQLRRMLGSRLEVLAGRLPDDLRTAILAALALHPATADMRTYELRRDWVARQVERVARTAERRIDEAQDLLAQEIAGELARERSQPAHPAEQDGWHIESFSAVYLLDGEVPEAVERRVIVPSVNGLAELALALDVPLDPGRPRPPLRLEMIKGGELVRVEELARTRTRYLIRLPHPLRAGESHEYEMRIQVQPGGPLRDYYVFRPERRCDNFDLRVRFDRRRPPGWVRRVAGEDVHSYNSFEGLPAAGELVGVDPTGEASEAFSGLRPHFGYGLQWGWPAASPR